MIQLLPAHCDWTPRFPDSVMTSSESPRGPSSLPEIPMENERPIPGSPTLGSLAGISDLSTDGSGNESQGTSDSTGTLGSHTTGTSVNEEDNYGRCIPPQPVPTPVTASRRMFQGEFVFDPDEYQVGRYNTILRSITDPLNTFLQNRRSSRLLGARPHRSTRVDAVRLLVTGQDPLDRASSRPYIVFFCQPDIEKPIKDLLEKTKYQEILVCQTCPSLSFSYKVIAHGMKLRLFASEFIAEPSLSASPNYTDCGTPLRLRTPGTSHWRRATLGGVLKVVDNDFRLREEYFAMTAGHAIDDWIDDEDDDDTLEALIAGGYSSFDNTWTSDKGQSPKRYNGIVSAKSQSVNHLFTFEPTGRGTQYFDWALFKVEDWKVNRIPGDYVIPGRSTTVRLPDIGAGEVAAGPVRLATGSKGTIDGDISLGMARIAIAPGEEVVEAYIVALRDDNISISDGDSGSWVVSVERNELVGHIVASDILGDVYVMPINAILWDINTRLKAGFSVKLPNHSDSPNQSTHYNRPSKLDPARKVTDRPFNLQPSQLNKYMPQQTPVLSPTGELRMVRVPGLSDNNDDYMPANDNALHRAYVAPKWKSYFQPAYHGTAFSDYSTDHQNGFEDISSMFSNTSLSHGYSGILTYRNSSTSDSHDDGLLPSGSTTNTTGTSSTSVFPGTKSTTYNTSNTYPYGADPTKSKYETSSTYNSDDPNSSTYGFY